MTLILGIETSCDETGVALYDSTAGLIAHTLYSQISLHAQYGGVVPELASRDHIKRIIPLIDQCLQDANLDMTAVDAIAYTSGPGLNGALLIGASVANGLAFSLNKPVIPIHHLEGHLLSPFLGKVKPTLPFIALLVSGGHTQIIAVEEIGKYTLLGDTLDDAAGEAFDKTAKLLGEPYPGGKYLAELAQNGQDIYELPRPMLHSPDLNFSFSGLKTAVLILVNKIKEQEDITHEIKQNLAAGIEEAITDVLVKKVTDAMRQTGIKTLVISGGVSANLTLREKMGKIDNANIFYPPLDLCTDNGAMIAIAGFYRFSMAKYDYSFSVSPRSNLMHLDRIN